MAGAGTFRDTVQKDQQFCQSCGAKQESFVDVAVEDVVDAVEAAVEDVTSED